MVSLGHHGRRISLRVLFHAPAGPGLGTGTRRRLSAVAFPVIGPSVPLALPLGPCPVCPRLDQEFEAFRQAAYWKAMHGRALQREAQLKVEIQRLQAMLRLREQQLFGARPRLPRQRLQRPRMRPTPTHRRDGRVASNPVGQVRSDATIPTFRPLTKTRSFRPSSAVARSVVSRSPTSPAPRIPPSWRSTSGPIAGSFAVAVTARLARVVLMPASSRPRHRPG